MCSSIATSEHLDVPCTYLQINRSRHQIKIDPTHTASLNMIMRSGLQIAECTRCRESAWQSAPDNCAHRHAKINQAVSSQLGELWPSAKPVTFPRKPKGALRSGQMKASKM